MTDTIYSYPTMPNHSAKSIGSGDLEVLATPSLVAFMENAACQLAAKTLTPEQTTVGTAIAIEHLAASSIGQEVTVTVVSFQQEGRRFDFDLHAHVGQTLIGRASHTRLIVDRQRFLAKL